MDAQVGTLVEEVLGGSGRAVIALLILCVMALIYEIKCQRAINKEIRAKLDAERENSLKVIDTMQSRFMDKNEQVVEKYHNAITNQQQNADRIKEMLQTLITFITNGRGSE